MSIELASIRKEDNNGPMRMRDTSAQDTVLDDPSRGRRRLWQILGAVVVLLVIGIMLQNMTGKDAKKR